MTLMRYFRIAPIDPRTGNVGFVFEAVSVEAAEQQLLDYSKKSRPLDADESKNEMALTEMSYDCYILSIVRGDPKLS
jgi:hypothetical protein